MRPEHGPLVLGPSPVPAFHSCRDLLLGPAGSSPDVTRVALPPSPPTGGLPTGRMIMLMIITYAMVTVGGPRGSLSLVKCAPGLAAGAPAPGPSRRQSPSSAASSLGGRPGLSPATGFICLERSHPCFSDDQPRHGEGKNWPRTPVPASVRCQTPGRVGGTCKARPPGWGVRSWAQIIR